MAQFSLERGDPERAEQELRAVLPDTSPLDLSFHHCAVVLAEALEKQGRGDEAIRLLKDSLVGEAGGGEEAARCVCVCV